MEDWEKVCEEEYDVIVCGTGMKECILSGLLSLEGKKILHIDRSPYYGGDCASLNIKQLWKKFLPDQAEPTTMGRNPDWNVDLVPKFIMASGELVCAFYPASLPQSFHFFMHSIHRGSINQTGRC